VGNRQRAQASASLMSVHHRNLTVSQGVPRGLFGPQRTGRGERIPASQAGCATRPTDSNSEGSDPEWSRRWKDAHGSLVRACREAVGPEAKISVPASASPK
jgi:hypothetical protein